MAQWPPPYGEDLAETGRGAYGSILNGDLGSADSTIQASDRNGPRPAIGHGANSQKARFAEIDQGVVDPMLSEDVSHPVGSIPFTDAP
jgi:hypothetical protein